MDYQVTAYGAVGDGERDDRAAIQEAIDRCSADGGGRVILDGDRTYLSSSIVLKENVELRVEKGSVLKASADLGTYLHPNEGQVDSGASHIGTPVTLKPSYAFIYAKDQDNITLSGEGKIDGNCYAFVKRVSRYYVTGDFYPRPTMIYIEHCKHVTIREITLLDAPFWTLHPAGCDDVLIDRIRILNPLDVANSDGIDPDHSSNVRILGCHIECADDAICLKSSRGNMEYGPTENVIIADCTLKSTSAAIKIGTEGAGNFRNIIVHDCAVSSSNRGISIQIRDEGSVENVVYSNIMIETRRFADCWWGTAEPIAISSVNRDTGTESGTIRNIYFENIFCDSENGVAVNGSGKVSGLKFRNVRLRLSEKSKWPKGLYDWRPGLGTIIEEHPLRGFLIRGAKDVRLYECSVEFDGLEGEALETEGSENVQTFLFEGK